MAAGATLIHGDAIAIPLADESVDLIVTSPPYWSQRDYESDGQIGQEPSAADFLRALWAVADECFRVLKPTGTMFVNLGDKMGGSGGHNNAGISAKSTLSGNGHKGGIGRSGPNKIKATRRSAPDRYIQHRDVPAQSLTGLPWRFALGLICPDPYRTSYENPADCWHDEPEGACTACRPGPATVRLRSEIVWHKANCMPESVGNRPHRRHEQWFMLTKSAQYFSAMDEIREPHSSDRALSRRIKAPGDGKHDQRAAWTEENPLGRAPGSVWVLPSEPLTVPDYIGVDHFAAFPSEWPRRLILGWSPHGICIGCGQGREPVVCKEPMVVSPSARRLAAQADGLLPRVAVGGTMTQAPSASIVGYRCACDVTLAPTRSAVVLDPFSGTGTVPMVARALGRYGIGIDLSADYLRLARWRVFESGHAGKAVARTNRERQGSLL